MEEVQAFGSAPEFKEVTKRRSAAAFQFAENATISRKMFPPSKAVKDGLQRWVSSKVVMSQLTLGTCQSDVALAWVGWPQQLPLPPENELASLWRVAHEDGDSCRILRARLGFASVFDAEQRTEQFHWHIALGCAMSYSPSSFPRLPQWARRAVLPEPPQAENPDSDSIPTYLLSLKCLVPRSEEECRREEGVRPSKADSQRWQELKQFEQKEIQRFKEVEARLQKWDSSIKKKISEVNSRKDELHAEKQQLLHRQGSLRKEVQDAKKDAKMHVQQRQVCSSLNLLM